jgi:chromosome segregation ATPase
MGRATRSAHGELDELRQRTAAERVKLRDLSAELAAAKAEVDAASDAITEGYASEDERLATRHAARQAVDRARKEQEGAVAKVRELQHRVDAAGLRIERAQREADTFAAEHARELLDELEGEAHEAAANLTRDGAEVVRAHRAYLTLRTEIDRLVASVAGATSRADGPPHSHPWESELRALERAVRETPEVPAPLPRWAGLEHRREQDNANRIEQRRRRGELSAADQAALAIGRVVTIE